MSIITTRQAIHHFVDNFLRSSPANNIIADWRIEKEDIVTIITDHLQNLGIYYVDPNTRELLKKDILFQLKNSKAIRAKVQKAENIEKQKRSQNRYKDSLD